MTATTADVVRVPINIRLCFFAWGTPELLYFSDFSSDKVTFTFPLPSSRLTFIIRYAIDLPSRVYGQTELLL